MMSKIKEDGTYPYQPANGTEGCNFMNRFCDRCKHDAEFQKTGDGEDGCEIIVRAMIFNPKDAHYPEQWISDDACGLVNPRCTAFEKVEG